MTRAPHARRPPAPPPAPAGASAPLRGVRALLIARAAAFRHGLQGSDRSRALLMRIFPIGCCAKTSEMLGLYLAQRDLGVARIVTGTRPGPEGWSHVWLTLGGYVIDITADQFRDEIREAVIVRRASPWHGRWTVSGRPRLDPATLLARYAGAGDEVDRALYREAAARADRFWRAAGRPAA